jgi:hypothetical protein
MSEALEPDHTTEQLLAAPHEAFFVCLTRGAVQLVKNLAGNLGRDDLTIVSADWLSDGRFRRRTVRGIVVDHAAAKGMTADQRRGYRQALEYIRS